LEEPLFPTPPFVRSLWAKPTLIIIRWWVGMVFGLSLLIFSPFRREFGFGGGGRVLKLAETDDTRT